MVTDNLNAYLQFTREQWQKFRQDTPLTLTEKDLVQFHGQLEEVSLDEVTEVYLPLSRLLNLYIIATQQLHQVTSHFLGSPEPRVPYLIGIAGSVAVGKSTTSRILQALLSQWPAHPKVVVVTTDGFLYPNAKLEELGLMKKKGFPESYDIKKLLTLLWSIKSGEGELKAPIYSHQKYDIVQDQFTAINHPDVVIVEGLNILQRSGFWTRQGKRPQIFVSDFFDFTIYVDAEKEIIKNWYIQRVLKFCQTAFQNPHDHFHFLTNLNHNEQLTFATKVWQEINEVNLVKNILPYRQRARLILTKGKDHRVEKIFLRKI